MSFDMNNWWWNYPPPKPIDWNAFFNGAEKFFEGAARFSRAYQAAYESARNANAAAGGASGQPPSPAHSTDRETVAAAALLGVSIDATEDQVRAALRAKMSASPIHPDHGGDGEVAKRFIAAQNLLIQRAKVRS